MPFTGGYSPSPVRTGGGDAGSAAPRVQRVFESLARSRGDAMDQTTSSNVGAENLAYARAIAYDLYGANDRFANEMNPTTSTSQGLLPRWEKIFAAPPLPSDTDAQRQARLAAKIGRFGYPNSVQPVADAVKAAIGALFVAMVYPRPDQAAVWWPGYGGGAGFPNPGCKVTAVSGNLVTIANLTNVPTSAPGTTLNLTNCGNSPNNGSFAVQTRVSSTSVIIVNNGTPITPDNGIGGTSGTPTIVWSMVNPKTPFTSDVARCLVETNPGASPSYTNADGTLAAAFFAAVNAINPVLDWLLPADETFDWYTAPAASHGASIGFYLDDPNNLDCQLFDG